MPKTFGKIGKFEPMRTCAGPKSMAKKLIAAADRRTVHVNPANRLVRQVLSVEAACRPQHIAIVTSKYWGPAGAVLNVSFMEKTDSPLIDRILSHMNAWYDQGANVQFQYKASGGDVRISRGPGGYWSYLGPDILTIPANQQTMNLEGFVMSTPESEYHRVVRHETGHTLGFPHEHMRNEIVNLLDPTKTITYFMRTQGWTKQEIQEQVLTPLDDRSLMETPADVNSIMCYQLPGSITKSGSPIPGGTDIDPSDAAFAAKLYPKVTTGGGGGSNPPPPAASPITLTIDQANKKVAGIPKDWSVTH